MSDARSLYTRAGEVFEAVADLAADEREAAFTKECGEDAALHDLVRGMLAHDEELARPSLVDSIGARIAGEIEGLAAAPKPTLEIGDAEGYRFLRPIGTGGMGAVWLAEQETPRREVACKVILPWQESDVEQRRFEREIDALARLRDPGITRIFAAGTVATSLGQRPFFAMELVDGPDILTWAIESELTTRERVALFVPVCDAVHHAHEQGVIHRDLKPANILVDRRDGGRPKVLDFGVARILDDAGRGNTLQGDGRLFGTLPYMAPEQAAGHADAIGPATDVYALGASLYHLVAGRLPLELSGLGLTEALAKIRDVEPLPLDAPVGAVTTDLDVVVRKALAKTPGARYPSAGALAEDLRAWLDDRPVAARPPGAVERLARFARKNRATVVGAILALVVAIVGAAVATLYAIRAGEAETRAEGERAQARHQRYAAEVGAGLALAAVDPREARRHLEAAPEEHRGWEWHHLAARLDRVLASSSRPGVFRHGRSGVAWMRNGDPVAFAARDSRLEVFDLRTMSPRHVIDLGAEVGGVFPSDDGTRVGCVVGKPGDEDIVVVDVAAGAVAWRTPVASRWPVRVFSFDDRVDHGRVVCSFAEARAIMRDDSRLIDDLGKPNGATCRDDDISWVSHRDDRTPLLTRIDGDRRRSVEVETRMPTLRITPAGLIGVDEFRRIRRYDPGTLEVLTRYVGHLQSPHAVSVADGGDRMATASRDGTVRIWDVATGRCTGTIAVAAHAIAISDDGGRVLAATDEGLVVLDAVGRDASVVIRHDGYLQAAEFCHGDRVVAVGGAGAVVHFHDATTGALIARRRVPGATAAIQAMCVSEDGRYVGAVAQWETAWFDVATLETERAKKDWLRRARSGSHLLTPHNKTVVVHSGGSYINDDRRIVDRVSREAVLELKDTPIGAFALSPDSDEIAYSANGAIFLANRGGPVLTSASGHADIVYALTYGPGGRRIASASNDSTLRIWSLDPLLDVARLRGHDSYVHSASWSRDGTRIVTAGGDGRAIVFDSRPLTERVAAQREDEALRDEMRPAVERLLAAGHDLARVAGLLRDSEELAGHRLDEPRRAAGLYLLLEIAGRR